MNKSWILIAEDGYGEAMWEESSHLYWCGGDGFAIVWERSAFNQEEQQTVIPLHREEVAETWRRECALYASDREVRT